MSLPSVLVFGAGIAGLSAAHYLSERGYKVIVIEPLPVPGGMARSMRYKDGFFSEYSWRGIGSNDYHNALQVMKEIPIKDSNVYDSELSRPIKFHLLDDIGSKFGREQKADKHYYLPYSWRLTPQDKIKVAWLFAQGWLSSKERGREVYSECYMKDKLDKYLSPIGSKTLSYTLGPFIGSGYNTVSEYNTYGFFRKNFFTNKPGPYWHYDKEKDEYWKCGNRTGWHLFKNCSSESWFDPWVDLLRKRGVEFRFGETLDKISYSGKEENTIKSVNITKKDGTQYELKGDYYILAVNPFPTKVILDKTPELLEIDSELNKFKGLTSIEEHRQISFRLGFNEKIHFPDKYMGFILTDSEFNLCFFSCDEVWHEGTELGKDIKSLWSFTATVDTIPGSLFNLPMKNCTKFQFIEEVLFQVYKCKALDDMVICANNGRDLKSFGNPKIEVWPTWIFPNENNGLIEITGGSQKKWVNQSKFLKYQPTTVTSIPNLLLAGAHCDIKGGFEIWSMELAVTSGRAAADIISGYNTTLLQKEPLFMRPFQAVDKVLYNLGLPNIFNFLWIFIFCLLIICYVVYNRPGWMLIVILIMIGLTIIVLT